MPAKSMLARHCRESTLARHLGARWHDMIY